MKKILALLTMFLIAGNFAFAQVDGTTGTEGEATATVSVQPKLNFQAVVRNANNELVYEQPMVVVINIISGEMVYSETHSDVTTNKNGLLTIVIGGEDAADVQGSMYDVDWSNATIEAILTFTPNTPTVGEGGSTSAEETTITVTSEVTAVPYALQAGSSKLNTDMIVNYISGIKLGTEADKYDVLKILDAIRLNENGLKNALKDTIVEYMKTRMDIAREIFHYYLDHVDSADVWNTYEQLMANPTAKQQVRKVIIDFIKTHKEDALEVLEYYAYAATQLGDIAAADVGHVETAHLHLAAVYLAVGIEAAQQRGLACAALAYEVGKLSLVQVEAHMGQQRAVLVADRHILQMYKCFAFSVFSAILHCGCVIVMRCKCTKKCIARGVFWKK